MLITLTRKPYTVEIHEGHYMGHPAKKVYINIASIDMLEPGLHGSIIHLRNGAIIEVEELIDSPDMLALLKLMTNYNSTNY